VEDGDAADVSRLSLGTHTGTHVDPPAHFLPGAATVDALPLDVLVGPAVVADGAALDARSLPEKAERVLLKTGADTGVLTPDSARWLVERGVRLVGTDGAPARAVLIT
jgi:arylformamidase